MQWDYPCNRTADGVDCDPYCLYRVLDGESERRELCANATPGGKDAAALARLIKTYAEVGAAEGMLIPDDVRWTSTAAGGTRRHCATRGRRAATGACGSRERICRCDIWLVRRYISSPSPCISLSRSAPLLSSTARCPMKSFALTITMQT